MKKLNVKIAIENVGGLSKPSKMPTMGISTPAANCNVGSKLRKVKGSVCESCYACKGMYVFTNVKAALEKRLTKIDTPEWEDSMVFLMENKKAIVTSGLFRWHDSGDLQNEEHLRKIVRIAERTPQIKHWLPTKEYGLIRKYMRENTIPANLIIRVSAPMVDGEASAEFAHTSTVVSDASAATCPAYTQNGECRDCRKCWDAEVKNVSYPKH